MTSFLNKESWKSKTKYISQLSLREKIHKMVNTSRYAD